MKDDYLWDGSGEIDPEIERLENVLGRYRYQAKPLSPAFDQQLFPRRARWWPKLAVAAAIILMALAGIWVVNQQQKNARDKQILASGQAQPEQKQTEQRQPEQKQSEQPRSNPAQSNPARSNPETPANPPEPKHNPAARKATGVKDFALATNRKPERAPVSGETKIAIPDIREPAPANEIASLQPLMNPFLDIETARHIEQAQLFFRSFRNTSDAGDFDTGYEKRRSRALLSQNATLRRGAEAKGNLPVQELLGSVEPFLLDIANLPDKPNRNDLRSIKDRMQKKEIIAALQIYSTPTLSQAF
jgi:hypothetical protein